MTIPRNVRDGGNVISAFGGKETPTLPNRSIGAILVDSGRLSEEDAAAILQFQRERNLRFGDAAIELKLITPADLAFALSSQFDYPYLRKGDSAVDAEVVAAYQPFSGKVEALRALRSQLMLRCFDGDRQHKTLAVVSPGRGEGRSFVAANLAVVFSQLGERTLLIDADMRNPRQHTLFGLDKPVGLSAVLSGRAGLDAIRRIPDLVDLSILPAGALPPNPQELLARPVFARLLLDLADDFDVVLIDTPAGLQYADVQTIATRAGSTLMLTRKNTTQVRGVRDLAGALGQGSTIVGTVLNEF